MILLIEAGFVLLGLLLTAFFNIGLKLKSVLASGAFLKKMSRRVALIAHYANVALFHWAKPNGVNVVIKLLLPSVPPL